MFSVNRLLGHPQLARDLFPGDRRGSGSFDLKLFQPFYNPAQCAYCFKGLARVFVICQLSQLLGPHEVSIG